MRPLALADHFCFRLFGSVAAPLLLLGIALVPVSAQDAAPAAEPAAQTEPAKAEETPKTDAAKESTDGELAGQEDLNAAIDMEAEDLDGSIIAGGGEVFVGWIKCDAFHMAGVIRNRLQLLEGIARPHHNLRIQADGDKHRAIV